MKYFRGPLRHYHTVLGSTSKYQCPAVLCSITEGFLTQRTQLYHKVHDCTTKYTMVVKTTQWRHQAHNDTTKYCSIPGTTRKITMKNHNRTKSTSYHYTMKYHGIPPTVPRDQSSAGVYLLGSFMRTQDTLNVCGENKRPSREQK